MVALLALSFAGLLSGATASCIHARDITPRAIANYGFSETRGPLAWHTLDPANALCAKGRNQSPININPGASGITTVSGGNRPIPNYPKVDETDFENLGNTVEVLMNTGSLKYQGADYALQQFHFHLPSEHRLREEHYPMEVHFVHQRVAALPDGSKPNLVLGFWFQMTDSKVTSKPFDNVLSKVTEIATPGAKTKVQDLNFGDISTIVQERDLYSYSGSLTTPPCSQGVIWLVSSGILQVSVETFNKAKSVVKFNSRYTQNAPGQQNLIEYACERL